MTVATTAQDASQESAGLCLHRAPFVVASSKHVIVDGGVLVQDKVILDVDRFSRLKDQAAMVVDHEQCLLMPGLVNCHCHLELSVFAHLGQKNTFFAPGDMPAWISALLEARFDQAPDAQTIETAANGALDACRRSGTAVIADIGNDTPRQELRRSAPPRVLFFCEQLGLTEEAQEKAQGAMGELAGEMAFTAHGPYSTTAQLIQDIKQQANRHKRLFPIHVAESAGEIELLKEGRGPFVPFLERRLARAGMKCRLDEIFQAPGCGAVTYLHDLGVLDERTLCVHCVHVDDKEIHLLAQTGAGVCTCPSSNAYLGVGTAPIAAMIQAGVRMGLGTDSLASNSSLSMWMEMAALQRLQPELAPEAIFHLATGGGADVLGLADEYGTIAKGRRADVLALNYAGKAGELFTYLVNLGETAAPRWILQAEGEHG